MGLEALIKDEKKRTALADIVGNISGSLLFGTTTDYVSGIRTIGGWMSSRLFNGVVATASASSYGRIRDYLFDKTNTTDESSGLRKYLVDFLAFHTLPTTTYGLAIGALPILSALYNGSDIDASVLHQALSKGLDAYKGVCLLSPIYTFVLPRWNDMARRIFHVATPSQKSARHHKGMHQQDYGMDNDGFCDYTSYTSGNDIY